MEGFNFDDAVVVYDKFYGYGELAFNRGFDILLNNNSVYTYEFWNYYPGTDTTDKRFEIDDMIQQKYFDNMYDAAEYARSILNQHLETYIDKFVNEYVMQQSLTQ